MAYRDQAVRICRAVRSQIGVLRDFKFAKLPDERIIIVDPAQRRIVDIVTKGEGAR